MMVDIYIGTHNYVYTYVYGAFYKCFGVMLLFYSVCR